MVSAQKKQLVQGLINDIKQNPIIGVVNLQNLPAQQLQKMRSMLKSKGVKLAMARKNLLLRSLSESGKKNIAQLSEKVKGMPALLFTKENPLWVFQLMLLNASTAKQKFQ